MTARRQFLIAAAALAGTTLSRPSLAQGDAVRILVGFPPGGAIDVVARAVADAMRPVLGKGVIVENKTGASGVLAVQQVARADPDGGTLGLCPSSILTLVPHVSNTLRVDPFTELAPVSTACTFSFGLATASAVPAGTLKEFVGWCKANPAQASFGSPGVGSAPHLIGEVFAREAGIKLVHVPYRGGAPAMTDLLGGQLPALVATLPNLVAPYRSGKIRILAQTATERIAAVGDVPTFSELGYRRLDFEEWFGFFAPAKTPTERIAALQRAIAAAVNTEATRALLTKVEFKPSASTPAELAALVAADSSRWERLLREIGFKPQS